MWYAVHFASKKLKPYFQEHTITVVCTAPLSASWERGYPDLPACGLRRGSTNGLVQPIFISNHSRPSRGAKPREADDTKTSLGAASLGWLPRSGDIYARGTA